MNIAALHDGGITPSKVQAYAGRTLDLLQAIEKTIDCLTDNCDLLAVTTSGIRKALEQLRKSDVQQKLDPEGRVCQLLGKCLDIIERVHHDSTAKRNAASNDPRLRTDDGVVEAYEAFLAALSEHHDAVHDLKEWVETHDALLEPALDGTFSNVDDLLKAMLAH
jgi:hypothetical protein